MFTLLLCVFFGFFAVIGLAAAFLTAYDTLRTGRDENDTEMLFSVRLVSGKDFDHIFATADYIRMRYFPAMQIQFSASGLSEEEKKRAWLLSEKYAYFLGEEN